MAVTATQLTSSGSETDATSYDTASITPTANRLVIAAVYASFGTGQNTPTLSGNGLTWVEIVTVADIDTNNKVSLFRAMGASPSAGAVTIDFAGQTQLRCLWSITEFANVRTDGTNGSGAIVQSKTNTASGTTTGITVTMDAAPNAVNAMFGGVRANATITPGTGFTEVHEVNVTTFFETEWVNAGDQTVDWTWASSIANIQAATIEIGEVSTQPAVAGVADDFASFL